ncbi:MAG: hypothetical protein F4Y50_02280 [Dehalococcoidia bacterium]|nr:hypothetical protein [Dehalococcoidia bacterium]
MDKSKPRRSIPLAPLAIAGALAAALFFSGGSASASDPPDPAPPVEPDGRPGDVLPPVGNTDVQALREHVPSVLFPEITETLQLNGSSEVYRAVAQVSDESVYRLENPVHSLDAKLSPGGVSISSTETDDWTWRLKFDGYGRGASLDHVANPSLTADGGRVEYHYSNGVTEWYVNGPLGLQQGFTFESRPSPLDDGPLEVQVAISGDITVEVNDVGTSALLHSLDSLSSLRYGGLYVYDASGDELGARLRATENGLSIVVDDTGANYPVTIDPFIEKISLAGVADDQREGFGTSVSLSGDIVAVGAPSNWWSEDRGAVYLFTLPDGEQTAAPDAVVLKSPRAVAGDGFGRSVAISGDTIVVGAPQERDEEIDSWSHFGAAYVFEKPSGGWVSTSDASRLTPPDVRSETGFGTSVSVSGDTVVVGTDSRSAYVFTKPSDGWADTSDASELTASDGSEYDRFGHSVAVNGDTVVVGAYLADLEADEEDFGAAYVFTKPSDGWEDTSDSVKLIAPDGAEGREFGWSLSLTGDTLVVGAPYSGYNSSYEIYIEAWEAEDKTPYLGSVYVYNTTETDWTDSPSPVKITAHSGVLWTRFGWSVSVSGDALAVGEPYRRQDVEDGGYSYRDGAAYVFTRPSGGWDSTAEHRELPKPDIMPYDEYGWSVYVSGEMVIAGAPGDSNENGNDAGSAYLFMMPDDGWASETSLSDPVTLKAHDGPAGDRFGQSVAVDGEALVIGVPGDHERVSGEAYLFARRNNEWDYRRIVLDVPDANPGGRLGTSVSVSRDTIVVGAPGTENGNDPGAAYVFMRPEDGWGDQYMISRVAKLTAPDATSDARHGYSVATDGDTIVVGSPGEGAAYVYTRPDTGWSDVSSPAKLTAPRIAAGSRFGHAVSLSGDSIVVGDPQGGGPGVAYVYTKPDAGWADTSSAAKLTASDAVSGDRFGYAVSASGDYVLVGAPGNENGEGTGAAYLFAKPDAGWSDTSSSAKLSASDGAAGDWFGHAVSVSGEFIAVGAYGSDEDQELVDSGAVYAFRRPQDGWVSSSNAQKVITKDSAPGDTFGYAVAVSGDTLAVGMPEAIVRRPYDLRGAHSGAARVFTWPGLFWVDTPAAFKVVPPNAESSRIFGVTLSADGNTAVVGTVQAVGTASSSAGAAKAFVYTRRDGEWDTSTPVALTLSDGGTYFTQGLAISENGDTVAVTHFVPASETLDESGTVLVFARPSGGWVATSQAARLTMPSGESEANFGRALSISGDTIVVGAPSGDYYSRNPMHKGAAFVFTKPSGGWVSTSAAAKLTALAGDIGDEFGRAVAVSGDTIVIAAPGDRNHRRSRVGSAYVFTRPSNGWVSTSESVKLVAPDSWGSYWSGNNFGSSVALKGDTVVVGATRYYGGGAYVFTKPSDGWDNPYIVSKLTQPLSERAGNFGASVSMSDDAIYVGASGSPGRVYVFPIPTGSDVFTGLPVSLSDPHGGSYDAFGGVVSAGPNGVAVGALLSDDHGEDRGAAYIFTEPSDGWDFSTGPKGHTAKLLSREWYPAHRFGKSVSPSGEAVGVGAPNSGRDNYPGAAYVFTGPFNSLFSRDDAAKLSPPDGNASRRFGWSVSLNSDAMAVGAPALSGGDGEAFVFTMPDEGWESTSDAVRLTSPGGQSDRHFGDSVSLSENTLAVGGSGSAYLFTKPDGTAWNSAADLTDVELPPPDSENASLFGQSVAITEDTLVVGMPRRDGVGAAYVYTRPSSGWASVSAPVKLTSPDGKSWDLFGASVAISGDTVVISAPGAVNREITGAVYVFTKPAGGWVSTSDAAKLTPESSHEDDMFGTSVAVEGDTIIVGGRNRISYYWRDDAYVFTKPQAGWVSASAPPINVFACHSSYDYYGQIGTSVGVSGDTVFVGAPNHEGIGAVCVYEDFLDE